jgi:hypothetical protein
MSERGKLGEFLNEVISWDWREFCKAEKDSKYSGLEASVFGLIRVAADGKLPAIKLAIDRVDGKVETPVKIEYPKVYLVFPEAKELAPPTENDIDTRLLADPDSLPETPPEAIPDEDQEPAAVLSLRQTLAKMADTPRQVPLLIHKKKKEIEAEKPGEEQVDGESVEKKAPLVKSVIAANLLLLATEANNLDAISEIFDQIDGKLVETIRILGDDLYLTRYALTAPFGAEKNKDGLYMIEDHSFEQMWKEKLSGS